MEVAVWEGDEGLADRVAALAEGRALVLGARRPGELAGRRFDLLVAAPGASGWAGAASVDCRAALVPGGRAELARALPVRRLVSYGMGRADTLTLSSLRDGRAAVCVQRAFEALDGGVVERQELLLPYDGAPPEEFLAGAGAALFLGLTSLGPA